MPTDGVTQLEIAQLPDEAWPVSVRARRAVLWISSHLRTAEDEILSEDSVKACLARLLLHPWAAVFVDAVGLPIEAIREEHPEVDGRPLRVYTQNPPADPPQNRVPIYVLPGAPSAAEVRAPVSAVATLNRLQMLQRAPVDADVFVVGAAADADFAALADARSLSEAFRKVVVIGRRVPAVLSITGIERVVHWPATPSKFAELLASGVGSEANAELLLIRVRTDDTLKTVALHDCVDQSYPITSSFETVPLRSVLDEASGTADELRAFLNDPVSSWRPYAATIPFPRHGGYRRELLPMLERFKREGAAATLTVWLQAEDGAGATTTLRHLVFDLARIGWPVLIAKTAATTKLNFHQLSTFLTRAGERFEAAGVTAAETPWIIAFDAQHSQLHWDFVTGVAGGLKRLQRPAIVIAVRPYAERADDARRQALGANRYLVPPLKNTLAVEEAIQLGDHLGASLPSELRRAPAEWAWFISDTMRRTPEGSRSLFWVALRFWLLRVPGTEEPLHQWLRSHLNSVVRERPSLYSALLEVAALSKHRLGMPRDLVPDEGLGDLRALASDQSNLLGLTTFLENAEPAFSLAHSLIAEELLRLASSDDRALASVQKSVCVGAFDLELHVLERLLGRDAIATRAGIILVEELVTAALRVDPREAPRNYQVRDRIVSMLERVPDPVWDDSQIFNHHLAKARRHLATDPIDASWTAEALREQLELAESHLLDAIENIIPADEARRESPLNLQVSLALTYDARAKLEHRCGDESAVARYREAANTAYRHAQRMDADNSYVLENFARFKLYQLSRYSDGDERIRHIVDAIALLEWEWETDQGGRREEPIVSELATAYETLEEGRGRGFIRTLAAQGSEAAIVALAKLAMRNQRGAETSENDALREAEDLLRSVPRENVTARSTFALYQVVTRLRAHAFAERASLLDALEGDPDYPWPMQVLLEHGILLFQIGGPIQRKKGEGVFRRIRDHLGDRSGALRVPEELRFLADPSKGFTERLRTAITIRSIGDSGRNYFGIPYGWGTVAVPARVHDFGPGIRSGTERDCFIRFTNFGPQAVPSTLE